MTPLSSQWQVRRETGAIDGRPPKVELSRSYEFSGAPRSDSITMLGLVCTIASEGLVTSSGSEPSRLNINRRLRIFFRPLRLSRKTPFTIELFTTDQSEGGKFNVRATPIGRDNTVLFADIGRSREDTATLIDAIMSGKDMTFKLTYEARTLLQFDLQNDLEFRRIFEETCKQFIEIEFAYQKARFQSAPSRADRNT
jgi:hypothetical protein